MTRYFLRAFRGHLRQGRTLLLLSGIGVALGVGSVLSIQILNANALAAFSGSMQAVSGEADLSVVGKSSFLPESLYVRVLGLEGVRSTWPLLSLNVVHAGGKHEFFEVIGVDFFAPVRFPLSTVGDRDQAVTDPISKRGWVAITPELAAEMGWAPGDTFDVSSGSRRVTLRVGATVDFRRITPLAGPKMMLMDLAQAQDLFNLPGQIGAIDLRLAPGTSAPLVARRIEERLGPSVQVLTPAQREAQAASLLAAFRLNLTALSLISLFVGIFLVYTTTQASLQRRRAEFGLLRSLGATRWQVTGLILGEALLLGILGTALGIPLGYRVAKANVGLVSSTLTNLYLLQEISTLRLSGRLYLLAVGVGMGGATLGAFIPALEVARRDARALLVPFALHERVRNLAGKLAAIGLVLLSTVGSWFLFFGRGLKASGFILGLALLLALPLMTPLLVRKLAGWSRTGSFGIGYSIRSLTARVSSSSFAAAALGIAVSMLVSVTLMIAGFRRTVDSWITQTVRADIYVSTESWARGRIEANLDGALVEQLTSLPGVRQTDRFRQFHVFAGARRIALAGVDLSAPGSEARFLFLKGNPGEARRRLLEEGGVLIGEPLAYKERLQVGDTLRLSGPHGTLAFPIVGVVCDYTTEGGSAAIDLRTMEDRFGPGPINNLALYLAPGVRPDSLIDQLKTRYSRWPLVFRSNRRLRQEVLDVFDQTFAVTRMLQGMALLIAVCGVALTLIIQARERVAELALYRALGARRGQIFRVFLGEGVSLGGLGLVLGFGGGIALAYILVAIINRDWFGWTVRMSWPLGLLGRQALTILLAAGAAAVYPALRASAVSAAELSRDDL